MLSRNEIRHRTIAFSRDWKGTTSEKSERQTFWNEFFDKHLPGLGIKGALTEPETRAIADGIDARCRNIDA